MYTEFWSENLTGRCNRKRDINNRMDIRKIGWGGVDWIHLAHVRTSGGPLCSR